MVRQLCSNLCIGQPVHSSANQWGYHVPWGMPMIHNHQSQAFTSCLVYAFNLNDTNYLNYLIQKFLPWRVFKLGLSDPKGPHLPMSQVASLVPPKLCDS